MPLPGPLPRCSAGRRRGALDRGGRYVDDRGRRAQAHGRPLPRHHRTGEPGQRAAQSRQTAGGARAAGRARIGENRYRTAPQRRRQHARAHTAGRFRQGPRTYAGGQRASAARRLRLEGGLHRFDRDVERARRLRPAHFGGRRAGHHRRFCERDAVYNSALPSPSRLRQRHEHDDRRPGRTRLWRSRRLYHQATGVSASRTRHSSPPSPISLLAPFNDGNWNNATN